MNIIQREFSGEIDKEKMAGLAQAFPDSNLHVSDLPYRFSSWAFDNPDNIGLWTDDEGHLLAWAVLQTPFWTIDYAYRPAAGGNIHRQLLAWADQRIRIILDSPYGLPCWFVNVFASQADRISDLEILGYTSQANMGEDSWSKVLMRRSTREPISDYNMPPGFVIRPLAGEGEADAYVELHRSVFGSRNMTPEWRRRTLYHPEHIADLDLVVVAPDGCLAALCVCWLNRKSGETRGQVEPLGVHENYRHLGLGQAILAEGLQRLRLHGADSVYIETDNYRNAAFNLYTSAGFHVIQDVLVFRKDVSEE